jgi:hypothetical protein
MVKIHDVKEKDGSVTYVFLCEEILMSGEMTTPKNIPDMQEKIRKKLEELTNELKEYHEHSS